MNWLKEDEYEKEIIIIISDVKHWLDLLKFFSSYLYQLICKFAHAVDPMVRHPDHL